MSVDKNYCMSSYLSQRYIEDNDKDFVSRLSHRTIQLPDASTSIPIQNADDIDAAIACQIAPLMGERLGLLLSGGMDSGILAAYLPGCDAYTFRFLDGKMQRTEMERAEYYASKGKIRLHYVDIDWNCVEETVDALMLHKGAPVHSIEPQIMTAALQAKADGVERMVIGDGSDYVFGGLDGLLAKDWTFDEFMRRATYIDPVEVLREPVSMDYLFERYRLGEKIDFLKFFDEVITEESYLSYENALSCAGLPYMDPYEKMKMANPLDLSRIRRGESKYLIRELFSKKYPELSVPEKLPMPRPVDRYFSDWKGPVRPEFKDNLDMDRFTGNQKWQLWCLERFLNLLEQEETEGRPHVQAE